MNLLQLVSDEVLNFLAEYFDYDEESLLDKYHEKRGFHSIPQKKVPVEGEYVGNVETSGRMKLDMPEPIYKNPKNLEGFPPMARGILLQNGDVYLNTGQKGLHDDILSFLAKKRIVPFGTTHDWTEKHPEEFVAIHRMGNSNIIAGSTSYNTFPHIPDHYIEHFDNANSKHTYKFQHI